MTEPNDQLSGLLIDHLLHNPDARVRLRSAIKLIKNLSAPVTGAYRCSLDDPSDKVVQLACWQLGDRGGVDNTEALFRVLNHSSWRVRLEACKALITQGISDHRIAETIEALGKEPEAAIYDAECDDFERVIKEPGESWPRKMWGRLSTILLGPQSC